jgi:hypothetical protein
MGEDEKRLTFSTSVYKGAKILAFRCNVCGHAGTAEFIRDETLEQRTQRIDARHTCSVKDKSM